MKRFFAAAVVIVIAVSSVVAEAPIPDDVQNAVDYPLIERFPGAVISHYAWLEDDTYSLPLSPIKNGAPERTQQLAGRVFHITYDSPERWSTASTYEGFVRALKKAGFKVLFCAAGQGLADTDEWPEYFYKNRYYLHGATKEQRFLSAKFSGPRGDVYATLYVSLGWYTHAVAQLDVIEVHKRQS